MREEREEAKKRKLTQSEEALAETLAGDSVQVA